MSFSSLQRTYKNRYRCMSRLENVLLELTEDLEEQVQVYE